MQIIPIPALHDNYIWTLVNQEAGLAVCVDPGDAEPVIKYLINNHLTLIGIIVTHHHWDHTTGIRALLEHISVPVYGPILEPVPGMTHGMQEGQEVEFPMIPMCFSILDIPGHTRGHIAYYGDGILFSGDTLFSAGCGRIFEGTAQQLYQSLQKLAQLPDKTLVYCGHEYTQKNLRFATLVEPDNCHIHSRLKAGPTVPATIALEKLTNPFLRCDVPQVRKSAEKYAARKLLSPLDVFKSLREWKDIS